MAVLEKYNIEKLDLESPYDVKWITKFLDKQGFHYSTDRVDETYVLLDNNEEIVGTGSYQNNVLKYLSVDQAHRSGVAFSQIVTHLFELLIATQKSIFVYTRPENVVKFKGLGFKLISKAEPLYAALEIGYDSIKKYKDYLLTKKVEADSKNIATIVMNCNPFTNGHKYLIEKASSESDVVYLFVVEENLSAFPFETRWKLIEKGISHLNNVIMLRGSKYIISSATFPSYFLKSENADYITEKQTELDLNIFAEHIIPSLGITKRYVGTENYCCTTARYNQTMKTILPNHNVEVIEVERKSLSEAANGKEYITASKVRTAIKEDHLETILDYIPQTTADFLRSDEAIPIIEKIRCSNGRH